MKKYIIIFSIALILMSLMPVDKSKLPLSQIQGLNSTLTAAELNKLDGLVSTKTELNLLHGIDTTMTIQAVFDTLNARISRAGVSGDSTGYWGAINGVLTSQTDLMTYLDTTFQAKGNYLTSETDTTFDQWLSNTPPAYPGDIPTQLSELSSDANNRLVTDTEKSTWNGKLSPTGNGSGLTNLSTTQLSDWSTATSSFVTGTPWTSMGYVTGTPWTSLGYAVNTVVQDSITIYRNKYNALKDSIANHRADIGSKVDTSNIVNVALYDAHEVDSIVLSLFTGYVSSTYNPAYTYKIHRDSVVTTNWSGLKTGLIGAWEFDETSGTTATNVVSGGVVGTYTGGVTVNETGKIGKCVLLDNIDGRIVFANDAVFNQTDNFTISLWYKVTDITTTRYLFTKGTGVYSYRINTTGQYRFLTTTLSPTAANTTGYYGGAGVWNHLVLTYSSGTLKVYENGVYEESLSFTGTIATDSNTFKIGCFTGSEVFNGYIDQLLIWNRVLPDAQITILNNTNAGLPVSGM